MIYTGTYKFNINWDEYKRLKSLGWEDKKIAKALNISPSCLCQMKKKRRKYGVSKKRI